MSERATPTYDRDQGFAQTPAYSHYQNAPMPPPVGGGQYRSQLNDSETQDTRPYPIGADYHYRGPQRRPVWPWLTVLGLVVVGGLGWLVVLASEEPPVDSERSVESAEVATDDPGATTADVAVDEDAVVANTSSGVPAASTDRSSDPFEQYLELVDEWGITDAPELTRDDAQTRAILGCSTEWAPGTVDAALAEAYEGFLQEYHDQGLCG